MSNTIRALWNGSLEPMRQFGSCNTQMKQLESFILRHEERLESSLDHKIKPLFEKHRDCFLEYVSVSNEQAFCDGFSLGMKLAMEALADAEQFL